MAESPTIVALRFTAATAFCLFSLRYTRRHVALPLRHLVPVGVLYAIAATLFTYAFFEAPIGVAIFGYYIANLLSSLVLGVWIHAERVGRPTVLAFAASVTAVILIAVGQTDSRASANTMLGFVLAVAAGLTATAISQEQKRLSASFDGEVITLAQVLVGGVVAAAFALVVMDTSIRQLSGQGVAVTVFYGFLFFACNWLSVYGFRHGPLGVGTMLLSIEVALGPLLAFAFFGERLNSWEIAGGLLTGLAVLATALRRSPESSAQQSRNEGGPV